MSWFSKRSEPSTPHQSNPAPSADEPLKVVLSDPGLDEIDPRQSLHSIVCGSGLTWLWMSQGPLEGLLDSLLHAAPVFGQSRPHGRGLAVLTSDPATYWTCLDGPKGSAVAVICTPESDTGFLFQRVVTPIESHSLDGVSTAIISSGQTTDLVAQLIESASVVPPWETELLRHMSGEPESWSMLPLSLRRELAGWQRVGHDLYAKTVNDIDGDDVRIFVGLISDRPSLVYPIAQSKDGNLAVFEVVASRGTFALEWLDPSVVAVRGLPEHPQPGQIDGEVDYLTSEVARALDDSRQASMSAVPLAGPSGSIWERLEDQKSRTARTFALPGVEAGDFVVTDRVRECVDEDSSTFESVEHLAQALRRLRGSGFGHTWRRGIDDQLLSPPWLTVSSSSYDPQSGRLVLSGCPAHEFLGMPLAYDLGAIDGRNMSSWVSQGHTTGLRMPVHHIYVSSTRTGIIAPLTYQNNVCSVDYHAGQQLIGALEFLGTSTGAVSVFDDRGVRRVLTVVEEVSGNEPVRFSPDGTWILVCSPWRDTTLIEVATGRHLQLQPTNACWWPLEDSTLLTVQNKDGHATPRLFSLNHASYVYDFPEIILTDPVPEGFGSAWFPHVSPDGSELIVQTIAGVTAEHQGQFGAGCRATRVNLSTGAAHITQSPFLDDSRQLERDVRHHTWVGRPLKREVELHPDLAELLVPGITEHEHLASSRWAYDAQQFAMKLLNHAIDCIETDEPVALMSDLIAAMETVAQDHILWEQMSEWLTNVQQATSTRVTAGLITGDAAAAWVKFGIAKTALDAGRNELVDIISAARR